MNLEVRLPNGEQCMAPLEVWVAALLMRLTPLERQEILTAVRSKRTFYATPGTHILRAEGMELSVAGGSIRGGDGNGNR